MNHRVRHVRAWCSLRLVLLLLPLALAPCASHAQWADRSPVVRTAEAATNLFASLDLADATQAFRLTVPSTWDVDDVALLRYGVTPVAVRVQPVQTGVYRIRTDTPVRGPYEVVVRLTTGRQRSPHTWTLVPLAIDADGRARPQRARAVRQRVLLQPRNAFDAPGRATNRALAFRPDAEAAVQVPPEALPPWSASTSFTVESWVRTLGRDEVLLSTWSGEERDPYLLDLVVAPSGRARAYFGRPGLHRSLMTHAPIADGRWHHLALAFEAQTQTLRFLLDGSVVDSLQGATLPVVPGRMRLALGGRVASNGAPPPARFSGTLDEVRIWAHGRRPVHIHRTMRHTIASVPEWRLVLGFDAPSGSSAAASSALARWPTGVERVASTRPQVPPLQNLTAEATAEAVRLQWAATPRGVRAFVVERSDDGQRFEQIARLAPEDAALPTASPSSGGPFTRQPPTFAFVDDSAPGRVVFYRIQQRNENGTTQRSATLKVGRGARPESSEAATLIGNFPNPFPASTRIRYMLDEATPVTLSVWNLTGNRIAQLVDGVQEPGQHEVRFDAETLPSGTYFVRMETPGGVQSHRMVLLK